MTRNPQAAFHHLVLGRTRLSLVLALIGCMLLVPDAAQAQLFGGNAAGGNTNQTSDPQSNAAQANLESGKVRGNERFLRENRRRGDFVGSDRFENQGFVGNQQGQTNGQALPSTLGITRNQDRSTQVNQPLPRPSKNQAYHPILKLDFKSFSRTARTLNSPAFQTGNQLKQELANPERFSSSNRWTLRLVDRTAILTGVVADAEQKELAELLVSFEPGVSAVRNELTVASSLPGTPTQAPSLDTPFLTPLNR